MPHGQSRRNLGSEASHGTLSGVHSASVWVVATGKRDRLPPDVGNAVLWNDTRGGVRQPRSALCPIRLAGHRGEELDGALQHRFPGRTIPTRAASPAAARLQTDHGLLLAPKLNDDGVV